MSFLYTRHFEPNVLQCQNIRDKWLEKAEQVIADNGIQNVGVVNCQENKVTLRFPDNRSLSDFRGLMRRVLK